MNSKKIEITTKKSEDGDINVILVDGRMFDWGFNKNDMASLVEMHLVRGTSQKEFMKKMGRDFLYSFGKFVGKNPITFKEINKALANGQIDL